MLMIQDLTIQTLEKRTLIEHLNLSLTKGDKIAIIGEEGNGKSTLLKGIVNPNWIHDFASMEGVISTGNDTIGYLPQMLEPQWMDSSILAFLLCDKPNEDILPQQYARFNELYQYGVDMGIDMELLDRQRMDELSGGERVKIQLLKLMLAKPDLYLLDEPTNDLDIETLEWLERWILRLEEPILFISHDEVLLEHCANGILHLEQIMKKRKPKWTFERISYPEYVQKRQALNQRQNRLAKEEKRAYQQQLERYRKVYQAVDHAQKTISRQDPHGGQLLKKKMKSVKSWEKRLQKQELTQKVDVEEQITLYFHDMVGLDQHKCVIDFRLDTLLIQDNVLSHDLHLQVFGKDKVVIIGKNGCGKTTLMCLIAKELEHRRDLKVQWMPQNYDEVLPQDLSGLQYLCTDSRKETITKVQKHLGSVKFTTEEMNAPIRTYSQGQKAKLLLVEMVLKEVNVLLLDEPTRNLSPLSNPVVCDILQQFEGCIISVSHDRKYIETVAKSCYRLDTDGLHLVFKK
ncbi:MAG: ATP-binding cassette domain-containing protein [Erysipelotrichaceae bacterium]|nr:ATP-binding cassette domain-containing protein [Erysipelotrichaceae bacterium]